jgi:hypothetical protein
MPRMVTSVLSCLIAMSGCAELRPNSTPALPANGAQPATVIQPQPTAAKTTAVATDASKSAANSPAPAKAAQPGAVSSQPTRASVPAKAPVSTPERTKAPSRPPLVVATPLKPSAAPALDLAALEQRLRDTHAIGVFTKLSLKNQVDDLLDQFRGFYKGQIKIPLAELRQRYDLLLLKVLSLLQDADQQLASAISSSREAIWGVLADPDKFAKI